MCGDVLIDRGSRVLGDGGGQGDDGPVGHIRTLVNIVGQGTSGAKGTQSERVAHD